MTSRDVVASLKRSKAKGSVWASALTAVRSVRPAGRYKVELKLKRPDSLLKRYLSTGAGTVESAQFLHKTGKKYGSGPQYIDGTGAFTMTTWKRGDHIDLHRAHHYWEKPALAKRIRLRILENSGTREQALAAGEIDGSSAIGSGSGEAITSKRHDGSMYYGAGTSTWNVALFNSHGALGEQKVRHALSLALDRKGIAAAASHSAGVAAGDLAAPAMWPKGQRPDPLPHNVDKAKKLISEADAHGAHLVLSYSSQSSTVTPMASAVQSAGKRIGLHIQLRKVNTAVTNAFQSDPASRKGTDLSLAKVSSQTGDPLEIYREFSPHGFSNFSGYANSTLDTTLKRAARAQTKHHRSIISHRARTILQHDLPWIPLISSPVAVYFGSKITGGPTNAAGTQQFPWAKYVGHR